MGELTEGQRWQQTLTRVALCSGRHVAPGLPGSSPANTSRTYTGDPLKTFVCFLAR
jgi:hypothetical protein